MIAVPLAVAALVAAVPQGAAHAMDIPYSASGSYQCLLTSGIPETTNVTLTVDSVPAEVRPGQKVPLSGELSITLPPQELVTSGLMMAKSVTIEKADFAVAAKPGSPVKVTTVKGTPADPSTTFTLDATLKMATYTVPKNARSDVVFSLPTKNTVANPLAGSPTATGAPGKVAFTLDLSQEGLVKSRQMACWLGDSGASAPVADIPVTPKQSTKTTGGGRPDDQPQATPSSPGGDPTPSAPADDPAPSAPADDPAPAPAGDPAPAPVDDPGDTAPAGDDPTNADTTPPGAPQVPAADDGADATPVSATTDAAVPNPTRDSGTYLPEWLILLVGALIPLTALGYAIYMSQRLRAAAARIDRPGRSGGGAR